MRSREDIVSWRERMYERESRILRERERVREDLPDGEAVGPGQNDRRAQAAKRTREIERVRVRKKAQTEKYVRNFSL